MTTLEQLRGFAITRSLGQPDTLANVLARSGFVQADPIRAPARAQDLTLRQRVRDYRNGDLEQLYTELEVEEDFFVNYGFVPRAVQALMHPRKPRRPWSAGERKRAALLLEFVAANGVVHPRSVEAYFAHGTVRNYWGGSSNATTHMLDGMHYRGLLRVVRRENGIRLYSLRTQSEPAGSAAERRARLDALIDMIVSTYAPLPAPSLSMLLSRMGHATPQWMSELRPAIARAKARLAQAVLEGVAWYWPAVERPEAADAPDERVRLLAPFDPIVWDRRRFELFWGWPYRFEAYTPLAKRRLGYYALPLLHRDKVIGWGNLTVRDGALDVQLGYVSGKPPRERKFKQQLDDEVTRFRTFMRV